MFSPLFRLACGRAHTAQRGRVGGGTDHDPFPFHPLHPLAPQKKGCPQAISEEEASKRIEDSSLKGNVVHLLSEGGGEILAWALIYGLGKDRPSLIVDVECMRERFRPRSFAVSPRGFGLSSDFSSLLPKIGSQITMHWTTLTGDLGRC